MTRFLPILFGLLLFVGFDSFAADNDPQVTEVTVIEVEQVDEQTQAQLDKQKKKKQQDEEQPYWELEVGGALMLGRYAMDSFNDSETGFYRIAPWLAGGYYDGNFFVESDPGNAKPVTIGYTAYESDDFQLNLVAMPFFSGFNESAQMRGDLITGLEERSASFDAGIEILSSFEHGQVGIRALYDISEIHSGSVVDFVYGYPLYFDKTVVWPSIGVSYVTEEANNYYYGIRQSEVRPDRPFYEVDGGFVTKFNLYFEHELSETNSIIGFSQLNLLNSSIQGSPIVEHSYSFTIGVGYIWIY